MRKTIGGGKKFESQFENEHTRSPFLVELIRKIQLKEEFDSHILRGHVVECSVDQQGSRYIQHMLDLTKDEQSQMKNFQALGFDNI